MPALIEALAGVLLPDPAGYKGERSKKTNGCVLPASFAVQPTKRCTVLFCAINAATEPDGTRALA